MLIFIFYDRLRMTSETDHPTKKAARIGLRLEGAQSVNLGAPDHQLVDTRPQGATKGVNAHVLRRIEWISTKVMREGKAFAFLVPEEEPVSHRMKEGEGTHLVPEKARPSMPVTQRPFQQRV